MKYRRVSLQDPGYHQGLVQAQANPSKMRSVSLATHEAGDIAVYNNAQMYR